MTYQMLTREQIDAVNAEITTLQAEVKRLATMREAWAAWLHPGHECDDDAGPSAGVVCSRCVVEVERIKHARDYWMERARAEKP